MNGANGGDAVFLAVALPHFAWQALRRAPIPAPVNAGRDAAVVITADGLRPEVCAASPEARRMGITAGMSLAEARLRAPGCRALERSPSAEAELQRWMAIELEHYSDRCQPLPPACWLLDLRGMEACLGPAPGIARRLAARLEAEHCDVRLGLAPTRTAALLVCHAGAPPILKNDPAPALAPLPLETLTALDGCGADTLTCLDLLARWGLRTLGELARLPRRALHERLGRAGLLCRRWARGEDDGLAPPAPPPPPSVVCAQTFEPALEGYLPLLPWLERELRAQAADWERADRALAVCELTLPLRGDRAGAIGAPSPVERQAGRSAHVARRRYSRARQPSGVPRQSMTEGSPWFWRYAPPLPHRDARRCLRQLETALALHPPAAPIAAAALEFRLLRPRRLQAGLFGDAAVEEESRERLLARLRVLLDDPEGRRCGSPRLRDLHRTDLFAMVPFQPSDPLPSAALSTAAAPAFPALRARRPPLPVRLDLPPLPALTEDADGLRLEGAICHIEGARLRVRRAWGPWRSSGAWWSDAAWSHDEWDVAFASPPRLRLLYDRRARRWFLLGAYD